MSHNPESNPLLQDNEFPPFGSIVAAHVEPAVRSILADNRACLQELLGREAYTWDSLILPLDEMDDRLGQAWSPVGHLNAVQNSPEMREAYNGCLPMLSDYATEIGQNRELFEACESLQASGEALDPAQQMVLRQALRDFRLAGVALPEDLKERYAELQRRLSDLTSRFSDQVLDATQGWTLHIEDERRLAGVPETGMQILRQAAAQRDKTGCVLTLDFPAYYAVITHAHDRALREQAYTAYVTRASDQGPQAGCWDNGPLIEEILAARHEKARLLDFANYAEYSLAPKMARSADEVMAFLRELAAKALPRAREELQELRDFAATELGIEDMQAWDVAYCSEKLRLARHAVSEEALRPYFPAEKVLDGLFTISGRLFDVEIRPREQFPTYHPDVRLYEVVRDGSTLAWFYVDLFAREQKRGGAWMDDYRVRRRRSDGSLQLPVAYLVCNFTPPTAERPSLLTHDEVTTLFHEFGHGLHHMLTRVEYRDVSGINGVPWDAVELPSQFMENWCWEKEAIPLISGHYETGAPLPEQELDNMLGARNFQAAMQMMRQLEFSIFDFRMHMEYNPDSPRSVLELADEVRDEASVMRPPAFNRYPHSFTHVFAGGYAAGYYSYKWAEVLAADAFSRFREEGIFNSDCGRAFRETFLEQGGSREPIDLFREFRGREPSVDALLQSCGLA